mgnify:CR=1 FL=1
MFKATEMTEEYAEAISRWQYPAPYEIYSMKADEEEIEQLMNGLHAAVLDEAGELAGFLAFGWAAQVRGEASESIYKNESFSDIALGLKPELCGKGLGFALVKCAVAFIKELFPEDGVRLTVRADNPRAIQVYRRAGFSQSETFHHEDGAAYITMIL